MPRPTSHLGLFAAGVCLIATGCSLFRPPSSTSSRPPSSAEELLREGDGRLAAGNYAGAVESLHQLLESYPRSEQAPQAMFQLAAVYLTPESPLHDQRKATDTLASLTAEYPRSPWAPAAQAVLLLSKENVDLRRALAVLREQIEELKQIDLESDG